MVNPSTANALRDRAQRASISLKRLAHHLQKQVNEQTPQSEKGAWFVREQVSETTTLPRKDVERLLFNPANYSTSSKSFRNSC
jgi:hypothetical protein